MQTRYKQDTNKIQINQFPYQSFIFLIILFDDNSNQKCNLVCPLLDTFRTVKMPLTGDI